jgi:hypothetical protein
MSTDTISQLVPILSREASFIELSETDRAHSPSQYRGPRFGIERKTIFTLRVDNYAPRIHEITWPLLVHYANKIQADIHVIIQREFPEWPVVYEKLQIHRLSKELGPGWNIYVDADTLIHPDCPDWTDHIPRDHVAHNGKDMAGLRWRYDQYFRRDGRHIGSCNWFAAATNLCNDLWRPLDDLTFSEAVDNIFPTTGELTGNVDRDHLIDDYTLSRNIAKFGLKHIQLMDICSKIGFPQGNPFFFHLYNISEEEKIEKMKQTLRNWKVTSV